MNLDVEVTTPVSVNMLVDSDVDVIIDNNVIEDDRKHDHELDYSDYPHEMQAQEREFENQDLWEGRGAGRGVCENRDLSEVSSGDDIVAMRLQAVVSVVVCLVGSIEISLLCFSS